MVDWSKSIQHFKSLSDLEAGMITLQSIGEMFPDLTWNDFRTENWPLTKKLLREEWRNTGKMSGPNCQGCSMSGSCDWNPLSWGSCAQNLTSDVIDSTGDALNWIGDKSGDAIRLLTDEEVIDGAGQIAAAYATYGGSEGIESILGGFDKIDGSGLGQELLNILGGLGSRSKDDIDTAGMGGQLIPGIENKYLVYGGIGVASLVLLLLLISSFRN